MARFTDARVPDAGMTAVFSPRRRWQRYLRVEAALAVAQAELGVIPSEAAEAIASVALDGPVDLHRVEQGVRRSSHPLMPLVVELSNVVGDPHGGWVHWGATTQNIMQTGYTLGLVEAHGILAALLADVLDAAGGLAAREADTVMAGRTHGQQAVPITFGFKVAAWIDQLVRHAERLAALPERLFVAMMGGATGTFASLGEIGPVVQGRVADQLGLRPMPVPSRSIGDPFAELVCVLGMLAATGGAIAAEVFTLMQTEFGELAEPAPPGVIGSSTMPHKRNPQLSQDVVTLAAEIRALVPLALEGMMQGHEADGARTAMVDHAVEAACTASADLLARLVVILGGLEVDAERMRANLDLTGGLIASEAVMLALGEALGRQRAHEVVHAAAEAARAGDRSFAAALAADPRVRQLLDDADIARLLDPVAHTGLAGRLAREAAARAHAMATQLRPSDGPPRPRH